MYLNLTYFPQKSKINLVWRKYIIYWRVAGRFPLSRLTTYEHTSFQYKYLLE